MKYVLKGIPFWKCVIQQSSIYDCWQRLFIWYTQNIPGLTGRCSRCAKIKLEGKSNPKYNLYNNLASFPDVSLKSSRSQSQHCQIPLIPEKNSFEKSNRCLSKKYMRISTFSMIYITIKNEICNQHIHMPMQNEKPRYQ